MLRGAEPLQRHDEGTMSIKRINIGPRMSQATVHNGVVYLAGQVALGSAVKEQTIAVLKQIDALLAEAGSDKSKLLSASVWLKDMETFGQMNEAWEAWVVPGHTPARATVEARLATPDYLVEIAVIAAVSA
jgi:enamine deaminase RidA (YjgF/YER057c/UK114 family)